MSPSLSLALYDAYPNFRMTEPRFRHYDAGKAALQCSHRSEIRMPPYDLAALWDAHMLHEYGTHDVAATMGTMADRPYVNNVPTMTGGLGYAQLKRFYKNHVIGRNPPDLTLRRISRTVGATILVDVMILRFTHTCEVDWMIPGVPPMGKLISIAAVAVVQFQDDKIAQKYFFWDQASILVQIGLVSAHGLPITGAEAAKKVLDNALPSNALIPSWRTIQPSPF